MLKGILAGIAGILEAGLKTEEVAVLKAHLISAKSMLEGILKEYEKKDLAISDDLHEVESELTPEAQEAKDDILNT